MGYGRGLDFLKGQQESMGRITQVLQEAIDPTTPLIERIKFLGIFSNNRDEFFRVRVAQLARLAKLGPDGLKDKEDAKIVLNQIKTMVEQQEKIFTETYLTIVSELANEGIFIINEKMDTLNPFPFHII